MLMQSLILLALAPFFAQAGDSSLDGIEAKRKTCLHRASTTQEMKACEFTAFREANAELLGLQEKMRASLKKDADPEITKRFHAANAAWVTLRDAQCHLKSAELLRGSQESLIFASCSVNMTVARVKELRAAQL